MIKFGGSNNLSAQIVTYPTYGFQTDAKGWRINVAGIAFQSPPFTLRQRMLIKMLGKTMKVDEQTLRGEIFQNRVSPFFVEAEKGLEIRVTVEETTRTLRKRSRKNGHFADSPRFPASVIERAAETDEFGRKCVPYTIEVADRSAEVVRGIAHLIPRYGVSVISDIDDTIKESQVTDRRELLFNTFLRDFRSVSGMADVYQGWQANGADFHYVSSSPWQLFDSLQRHQTENGFPTGTMHLRNFRLRDQLLKPLPIVRRRGKATAIRKMLKDLPDRKFILVGDSGEKDPEIYLKMCRRHPGQIAGVFIREIQERPMVEERVRKLHREAKGFICSVFSEPQTLANNASQIFDKLPPAI
ncbi:MAG: DUF2183 domain-containing protein [Mariniblastus sp.]|nr:DUF2183 domain-containing protein [Mariniblastus sp.]